MLTTTDADGWPLAVRCRSAVRTDDGYLLEPPAGAAVPTGPACFTAHTHTESMDAQENVVLVGSARTTADGRVHLRAERALADWSITGPKLLRPFGFVAKGRPLRSRLQAEAERRGQPVPKVNL